MQLKISLLSSFPADSGAPTILLVLMHYYRRASATKEEGRRESPGLEVHQHMALHVTAMISVRCYYLGTWRVCVVTVGAEVEHVKIDLVDTSPICPSVWSYLPWLSVGLLPWYWWHLPHSLLFYSFLSLL